MYIVKYMILVLLFILVSLIGYLISKKFSNRVHDLKQIKNALKLFETKIKFTYEPVPILFREIAEKTCGNTKNIFLNSLKNMEDMEGKSIGQAWEDSVENTNSCIDKEDKEYLKTLGKLLGKTDINGQILQINLVQDLLEQQIKKANIEKEKNEELYKKLGLITGCGLVILLI